MLSLVKQPFAVLLLELDWWTPVTEIKFLGLRRGRSSQQMLGAAWVLRRPASLAVWGPYLWACGGQKARARIWLGWAGWWRKQILAEAENVEQKKSRSRGERKSPTLTHCPQRPLLTKGSLWQKQDPFGQRNGTRKALFAYVWAGLCLLFHDLFRFAWEVEIRKQRILGMQHNACLWN